MRSFLRAPLVVLGASLATVLLLRGAEPTPAVEDTILTSDHLDSRSTDKEVLTILWDHVTISATNLRVTCDRAELVSLRSGDATQLVSKQNRFKSLILTGNVTILQRDSNREATAGRAEIRPLEDSITLTEKPKVVDFDKAGKIEGTWEGEKLLLLRGERRVQGEKVRITGPGIKDLGFDKDKAPPLGDAAPKPEPPK
jgi:lipopolysaccharide export system protein LptA